MLANCGGVPSGIWIGVPETYSWVAFHDASAFGNWDDFSGTKLTRSWPEWGFHYGLNGFQRQATTLLYAMRARGAGRPWHTPADSPTLAYPVRAHVRLLMRKFDLSPSVLAEQLARDIATESELLAKIDQAQLQVIALVRNEKLSAFGRRAQSAGQPDPTAVHEKLDPKLFLGPRTIDLCGWVRQDTNLPFQETQGYRGPYFDLVRFRVDEVIAIWPPIEIRCDDVASTIADERRMEAFLRAEMAANPKTARSKAAMRKKAAAAGVKCSDRAFSRAWIAAIKATGAHNWSRPGRRS